MARRIKMLISGRRGVFRFVLKCQTQVPTAAIAAPAARLALTTFLALAAYLMLAAPAISAAPAIAAAPAMADKPSSAGLSQDLAVKQRAANAKHSANAQRSTEAQHSAEAKQSTDAPQRIAFVDMDAVLANSSAVRARVDQVEANLDGRRREIDRKTAEYRKLREGLDRQDSILTDEEKSNRRKRIQQLKTEIEDLQYEANRALRESEQGVIEPIIDAIMERIQELGKREGFDMILRGEAVLYGGKSADLTDRVIEELDTKGLPPPPKAGERASSRDALAANSPDRSASGTLQHPLKSSGASPSSPPSSQKSGRKLLNPSSPSRDALPIIP